MSDLAERAIEILERLVAFDTTSRDSNLPLIEWVEDYLAGHGVQARRIASDDGAKSNLLASIGPMVEGGVVLSGHTDVVPVDGQPWTSDPWVVTPRDGKLFGRGTADMKSFIALALAAVPEMKAAGLKRPCHLAFSYDEEVGCLGAPRMIEVLRRELPRRSVVIVGEPTGMEAVSGHKGIATFKVTVTGHEAHSSLTHLGLSANMTAIKLMGALAALGEQLAGDAASPYLPKGSSLTVGMIEGGRALNILARRCVFGFDLRCPRGVDPMQALEGFFALCRETDTEMKARFPEAGVEVELISNVPAFEATEGEAEQLARRLAGDNGPARVVSYAAEAGQFQQAGFEVVLCGPGSIDQAHQPDEFIEVSQIERGSAFMRRLVEALSDD
ncbi:MAG TPA: acetylornithine deacetylase [Caulobacteraceae bacterium]|nr:acetylornithine deacetylase [Caulobacteraceae bacterium]